MVLVRTENSQALSRPIQSEILEDRVLYYSFGFRHPLGVLDYIPHR